MTMGTGIYSAFSSILIPSVTSSWFPGTSPQDKERLLSTGHMVSPPAGASTALKVKPKFIPKCDSVIHSFIKLSLGKNKKQKKKKKEKNLIRHLLCVRP